MNLNTIFRRFGETAYNTPVAVVAELGGQETGGVEFINPPYELTKSGCESTTRQQRTWYRGWKHCIKLFGIYFYVSNVGLKRRSRRDAIFRGFTRDAIQRKKELLYERQQHRCPICGNEFEMEQMEYHHILPYGRFPELKTRITNGIVLCHRCHKEIHMNPWKNIKMMQAKADELGIDLAQRYEM